MLRIVSWNVTAQTKGEPLLEIPVLEALVLGTPNILATAAVLYNELPDLSHLCTDHEGRWIARVYDGFCHSDHGDDKEDFEKEEQ